MKKQRGTNSRAIKRKLGIDAKKIDEMFKNVHQLLESEGLTDKSSGDRFVKIDKHALKDVLEVKVQELEGEVRKHHQKKNSENKTNKQKENKETQSIKINIS